MWRHPLSLITGIDRWIGRTLFVPGIVKLCQITNQTQFAVSRLFWFIAALDGLYRAETLLSSVLFGGLSLMMMITASLRANDPTTSFMWFRMFALVLFAIDVLRGAMTSEWAGVEFWVFVLIAEYAATIRTVPPRRTEKRATKMAEARSGAQK